MLFFFNMAGAVYDPDHDGVELVTISDARIEAVRLAAGMLRDRPEIAWLGMNFVSKLPTRTRSCFLPSSLSALTRIQRRGCRSSQTPFSGASAC